jgi:hypothetical protein
VRKDVEVMSEQVRGDRKRPRKFGGRPVGYNQLVDDLKPVSIRQRTVDLDSPPQ